MIGPHALLHNDEGLYHIAVMVRVGGYVCIRISLSIRVPSRVCIHTVRLQLLQQCIAGFQGLATPCSEQRVGRRRRCPIWTLPQRHTNTHFRFTINPLAPNHPAKSLPNDPSVPNR